MNLSTSISEIEKFWNPSDTLPFGKTDNRHEVNRIKNEFEIHLSDDLLEYITRYAPAKDFYFTTVGNPLCVYGIHNLKYQQDGYNYNTIKNGPIENWDEAFFLLGDEGADPVVVDLNNTQDGIQKLMHGAGNWEGGETIADNYGQFLLCSAALHHALTDFEEESIVDDEKGFNLAPDAAKWYFKNMETWAGMYYNTWCSVFDNH